MNNSKTLSGFKDHSIQNQCVRITLAFDYLQSTGIIPDSCSFTNVINNIDPIVKLLTLGDDDQFIINGRVYFISNLPIFENH